MPAVAFYHRAGQKAGPVGTARAGETALVFVAPGLPRFARNDGGQTSPVIASLTSALPTHVDETALVFVAPGLPRFARNDGESSAQASPRHCESGTGLQSTRVDETGIFLV